MNSQVEKNMFSMRRLEDIPISGHHRIYISRPLLSKIFFSFPLCIPRIEISLIPSDQWLTHRKCKQSFDSVLRQGLRSHY